jgi:hypothetical protein
MLLARHVSRYWTMVSSLAPQQPRRPQLTPADLRGKVEADGVEAAAQWRGGRWIHARSRNDGICRNGLDQAAVG